MTSPKKSKEEGGGRNPINVPSQEDEEDILNEVGAERDEETGGLVADEDKVREIGALDPESVRMNRHVRRVADAKRKREKVAFGIEDPIAHYDGLLRVWSNEKIEIRAQNLVTREQHTIKSQPRSGFDLYDTLKAIHGQRDAHEYKIEFVGAQRKEWMGSSRIVMPDARVPGQQPPQYYPPSQGYPPPQASPQPQAPTFVMPPPGTDPMQMVQQMFEMFRRFQTEMMPPTPPAHSPQPNITPTLPPMPQTSDPAAMMNWMQQSFEIFQRMQSAAAKGLTPQPQIAPQAQPQSGPTGMPQFPPPPGTAWMYYIPPGASTGGWVAQPIGTGGAEPQRQSPFQRPQYYPQGDPNDPRRGYSPPYQQRPPERVRSPAQMFRESISSARELYNTAQELNDMFSGGGGRSGSEHEISEDNDSSVEIIDVDGKFKYAKNRETGAISWAETGIMVVPPVLKWLGEQNEKIQTARQERQRPQPQQRRQQALPPGFVEVDENYRPPKGFVAVPVDQIPPQQEHDLPEPPANVPPAIDEEQEAPHPAWGAPEIPQTG